MANLNENFRKIAHNMVYIGQCITHLADAVRAFPKYTPFEGDPGNKPGKDVKNSKVVGKGPADGEGDSSPGDVGDKPINE